MKNRFKIVTIVGAGLLGASLGLAVKQRSLARTVRGVGHRQASLDKALDGGALDEGFLDVREAVPGADFIVVCTPAARIPEMLDLILPCCSPETVVTDVASTKANICRHARDTWPRPLKFVGSHPMAGSEKSGPEHASAHLYEGSTVLVEEGNHLAPAARDAVCEFWRAVGADVVGVDPVIHDAIVARTSHLPHILAAAVASLVARQDGLRPFIGKGFKDFTRIAAGRPEVWRDICLTNGSAIVNAIDEIMADLEKIRHAVQEADGTRIEAFFEKGRLGRHEVLGA